MLLSIGMIVKNEEKYLRDCLEGIRPILEQVRSELIIYDTGSTDATVEIAKEFTDKVYQIEWRNDFAWARNHTIGKARGKWYMYLDADEIFQDVADIVSFFNSGEYKRYKSAGFVLRNMKPSGLSSVFRPLRLIEADKGLRFNGKIHEFLPLKMPVKSLESSALHYGYYYETQEDLDVKIERNTALLLKEHEENPNDIRTLYHLVRELGAARKHTKMKPYFDSGMTTVKNNLDEIYSHAFYHELFTYHAATGEHEKVVSEVRQYFKNTPKLYQNALPAKRLEAMALFSLNRFDESAIAYIEALKLRSEERV